MSWVGRSLDRGGRRCKRPHAASRGRLPPADDRGPTTAGRRPRADDRSPKTVRRRPSAADRGRRPKTVRRRPRAEDHPPKAAGRRPRAEDRPPKAAGARRWVHGGGPSARPSRGRADVPAAQGHAGSDARRGERGVRRDQDRRGRDREDPDHRSGDQAIGRSGSTSGMTGATCMRGSRISRCDGCARSGPIRSAARSSGAADRTRSRTCARHRARGAG